MIWFLLVTQFFTLLWVFWLDQEYKAINRYVQGLNGADHMAKGYEPYVHPMRDEPGRFA